MTGATQPSIEDVVTDALPWIPKVKLCNPFLAYENGDRFPEIVYECSRVTGSGNRDRYWIALSGELTLHGLIRRLPISARVVVAGDSLWATGDFAVRQSDYDITLDSGPAGTIRVKDELKCKSDIVARKHS